MLAKKQPRLPLLPHQKIQKKKKDANKNPTRTGPESLEGHGLQLRIRPHDRLRQGADGPVLQGGPEAPVEPGLHVVGPAAVAVGAAAAAAAAVVAVAPAVPLLLTTWCGEGAVDGLGLI